MIAIRIGAGLALIFEPGNLERLKQGKPIVLDEDVMRRAAAGGCPPIESVLAAFSPDIEWTAEQLMSRGAEQLDAILKEGMTRPEKPLRPHHPTLRFSSDDLEKRGGRTDA